jgi:predicted Zn-dependent peptidase
MDRVRTESVSESELQYARNYLNGIFTLRLERSSILAGQLANQILYDLPADYLETYVSKVSAVKAGEVLSAAKALCDGSRAAIVAVGDAQKIKADLAGFGPVTVYTAEGKPEGPETPSDP